MNSKIYGLFKKLLVVSKYFLLIGALASCISTTTLQAIDSGGFIRKDVEIHVNKQFEGDGVAIYSDRKTIFSSVPVLELRKKGCKIHKEKLETKINWVNVIFSTVIAGTGIWLISEAQSHDLAPLALGLPLAVVGIALLPWIRNYVPEQEVEFQCLKVSEE